MFFVCVTFLKNKQTRKKKTVILIKMTHGILMGLGRLLEVNMNPVPTITFIQHSDNNILKEHAVPHLPASSLILQMKTK